MGVACSPVIFQAKMSELMATLEFIQAYSDYLLCISMGSLDDHVVKVQRVFIRLQNAGLKVNARKSCFCAMETEYLGYILSIDGNKPKPENLHTILTLTLPQNENSSVGSCAWSSTTETSGQDAVKC